MRLLKKGQVNYFREVLTLWWSFAFLATVVLSPLFCAKGADFLISIFGTLIGTVVVVFCLGPGGGGGQEGTQQGITSEFSEMIKHSRAAFPNIYPATGLKSCKTGEEGCGW